MADGNDALFYARVPVGTDGNGAMFYARVPEEATKLLDGAPFRVFVAILSFRRRDSETIEVSSRDIATKLGYRSRDSVRHLYPKILESGLLAREQVTAGRWVWRINFNLRGGSELGEGGGPNRSTPEQTHGARQWSRGARANGPGGRAPMVQGVDHIRPPSLNSSDGVRPLDRRTVVPPVEEQTRRPTPAAAPEPPPDPDAIRQAREWAAGRNPALREIGRAMLARAGIGPDAPPAPPAGGPPPESAPPPPPPPADPEASGAAALAAFGLGPGPGSGARARSIASEGHALAGSPDASAPGRLARRMAEELRDRKPDTLRWFAHVLELVRLGSLPAEAVVAAWRDGTGRDVPRARRARAVSAYLRDAREARMGHRQREPPAGPSRQTAPAGGRSQEAGPHELLSTMGPNPMQAKNS